MKNFAYFDKETNVYPFALAFFMFRAGDHKLAIEFLSKPNNADEVIKFGELYKKYFVDFGESVPRDSSMAFFSSYENDNSFLKTADIYRDGLIRLMIGSVYHPDNESAFWEILLPSELET
jgi:fructose-specific component phosphotransferase system IIB-like protein